MISLQWCMLCCKSGHLLEYSLRRALFSVCWKTLCKAAPPCQTCVQAMKGQMYTYARAHVIWKVFGRNKLYKWVHNQCVLCMASVASVELHFARTSMCFVKAMASSSALLNTLTARFCCTKFELIETWNFLTSHAPLGRIQDQDWSAECKWQCIHALHAHAMQLHNGPPRRALACHSRDHVYNLANGNVTLLSLAKYLTNMVDFQVEVLELTVYLTMQAPMFDQMSFWAHGYTCSDWVTGVLESHLYTQHYIPLGPRGHHLANTHETKWGRLSCVDAINLMVR